MPIVVACPTVMVALRAWARRRGLLVWVTLLLAVQRRSAVLALAAREARPLVPGRWSLRGRGGLQRDALQRALSASGRRRVDGGRPASRAPSSKPTRRRSPASQRPCGAPACSRASSATTWRASPRRRTIPTTSRSGACRASAFRRRGRCRRARASPSRVRRHRRRCDPSRSAGAVAARLRLPQRRRRSERRQRPRHAHERHHRAPPATTARASAGVAPDARRPAGQGARRRRATAPTARSPTASSMPSITARG